MRPCWVRRGILSKTMKTISAPFNIAIDLIATQYQNGQIAVSQALRLTADETDDPRLQYILYRAADEPAEVKELVGLNISDLIQQMEALENGASEIESDARMFAYDAEDAVKQIREALKLLKKGKA
jgi:hypothetical protein